MEKSIKPAHQLAGPPVAAQPDVDRFVALDSGHLMVTTNDGRLFCHYVGSRDGVKVVADAVRFTGPPVAAQPVDRHVLLTDSRLFVITADGGVFRHEIPTFRFSDFSGYVVEPAIRMAGPPVAANPQDRAVFCTGAGLIVLTWDGGVFGHHFDDATTIGPAFRCDGPPVAAKQGIDKWVTLMGHNLLVVTDDGRVFCHEIDGRTVKDAYQVPGPAVAAQPVDRHLLTSGLSIYVITRDGRVFQHPTSGFAPIIR